MGEILPFVARVRDRGDWTADERARLEDLAQRFEAAGVRVEIVFGVTDDGDPWCVVKDENEDVLVHVARIGKTFVVHYVADEGLRSGDDLPAALGERLQAATEPTGEVVPFARQAQLFLALVVATAFFYEAAAQTFTDEGHAHAATVPDEPPPAPATPADAAEQDRREVLHVAVIGASDTTPDTAAQPFTPAAAPQVSALVSPAADGPISPDTPSDAAPAPKAVALAASEETTTLQGSAGDDLLQGTAASELILGGDGDDTLVGGGGADTLVGGAGNDVIVLGPQVVAEGGAGADTFIVEAPHVLGHPDTLLGVILDFRPGEGDRMLTHDRRPVTVIENHRHGDDGPQVTTLVTTLMPPIEGRRVEVDLNGDGIADGYVFVAEHPAGHAPPPPPMEADGGHEPPMLPGGSFSYPLIG